MAASERVKYLNDNKIADGVLRYFCQESKVSNRVVKEAITKSLLRREEEIEALKRLSSMIDSGMI